VTASCDVGVVEAQKSGGKNHPKSASCRSGCVMRTRTMGRHFKKWEQSTARATARCCQKCDGHCVTGNVYSSSGSLYHRVNNTKYQICLGMCFMPTLPIAYVPSTRIKPWSGFDLGGHVRPIMNRGRRFDTLNENALSRLFVFKLSDWDVSQCQGPFLNLSSALFQT